MGNHCNAQPADAQFDVVPAYPVNFSYDSTLEPSREDLPRLGLRGQGPSSIIDLGHKGQGRHPGISEKPLHLPPVEPFSGFGDEGVLYPVPVPDDYTPPGKSRGVSEYPRFFPVSSYVSCDAPVRKRSKHVLFANSPTHSVHRSEYGVEPYSEVYGMHPTRFDFDEFGNKQPRKPSSLMNPFFPQEPGYCHRPNSSEFGSYDPGTFTRTSAYRSSAAACTSDMYSSHAEWGDW